MLSKASVSEWISETVKKTFVWSVFRRLLSYFRQIRIVRLIFTVTSYTVTLLGTGVAFVIFASVVLFVMPFIVLCAIVTVFVSVVQSKKVCRKMSDLLDGKNVLVFVGDRGSDISRSCFGQRIVTEHAAKKDCVSLIISPYLISPKGLIRSDSYISFRQERENIFTVRKYVYFDLKRKVLERKCQNTLFFF